MLPRLALFAQKIIHVALWRHGAVRKHSRRIADHLSRLRCLMMLLLLRIVVLWRQLLMEHGCLLGICLNARQDLRLVVLAI